MKKTNKKGFTLVELVIVIAVIAILAAVLIPTFSNIVKAANISADLQKLASDIQSKYVDYVATNNETPKGVDTTSGFAFVNTDTTTAVVLTGDKSGEAFVLVLKDGTYALVDTKVTTAELGSVTAVDAFDATYYASSTENAYVVVSTTSAQNNG